MKALIAVLSLLIAGVSLTAFASAQSTDVNVVEHHSTAHRIGTKSP